MPETETTTDATNTEPAPVAAATLGFAEAMDAVRKGKSVTRPSLKNIGRIIKAEAEPRLNICDQDGNPIATFSPDRDWTLTDDWEIVSA